MKKLFILLVLATLSFAELSAQWEQCKGPYGVSVSAIALSGNYIIIASDNGLYRSTNGGLNWLPANNGIIDDTVLCMSVIGNQIMAGSKHGVYLSTNNGDNWTNGAFYSNINCCAINNTNMFVGSSARGPYDPNSGLYTSSVKSIKWSKSFFGNQFIFVNSITIVDSVIYVGTDQHGIFMSSDNGISWTQTKDTLTNNNIRSIAVNGNNIFAGTNNGLMLSTNKGQSWTDVNNGLTAKTIRCLTIDGKNMYAGTYGGIFLSTNNGTSWTAINNGLTSKYVYCIVVKDSNIYIGTEGGVFLSTNNGSSWSPINNGLINAKISSLAYKDNKLFAGTLSSILYCSTDNGSSWSEANNGLEYLNVEELAVLDKNLYAGTGAGVFSSSNDGVNWTKTSLDTAVFCLLSSGSSLYASSYNNIYISSDKGSNWTKNASNNGYNRSMAIKDSSIFIGSSNRNVYTSSNNGFSWSEANEGLQGFLVYSLSVIDTCLFACTDYGSLVLAINMDEGGFLFSSCNNGTNWDAKRGFQSNRLICSSVKGQNLFIGSESGIYIYNSILGIIPCNNSGLTNQYITCFTFSDSLVFAGTWGGSVFRAKLSDLLITGVNDPSISTDCFAINPNPSFDYITISGLNKRINSTLKEPLDISIYNTLGECMKKPITSLTQGDGIRIDVSDFPQGLYYCSIGIGNKKITKSFSVVR